MASVNFCLQVQVCDKSIEKKTENTKAIKQPIPPGLTLIYTLKIEKYAKRVLCVAVLVWARGRLQRL